MNQRNVSNVSFMFIAITLMGVTTTLFSQDRLVEGAIFSALVMVTLILREKFKIN